MFCEHWLHLHLSKIKVKYDCFLISDFQLFINFMSDFYRYLPR